MFIVGSLVLVDGFDLLLLLSVFCRVLFGYYCYLSVLSP